MGTRDGAGSPPACRTHARGVPTMDGCWYYLHTFRVKTTRACLIGVRDGTGRTRACRMPLACVPTMDEGWYYLHTFRVKTTRACLVRADGCSVLLRPRSETRTTGRAPAAFTRKMSPRIQPSSIVGTPLVCVLHACVRPACLPACALRHHAPHAPCVRPVPSCTTRAGVRPACPRASCAISHHTRRCASCVARRLAWCYLSSRCRSPESACPFQRPTSRCRLKASLRRSLSDRSAAHC